LANPLLPLPDPLPHPPPTALPCPLGGKAYFPVLMLGLLWEDLHFTRKGQGRAVKDFKTVKISYQKTKQGGKP
jgi:hypothetical protein